MIPADRLTVRVAGAPQGAALLAPRGENPAAEDPPPLAALLAPEGGRAAPRPRHF